MQALMKSPGVFYPQVGRPGTYPHVVQDYLDVLGDCPVLEISGGVSFGDAVDHCIAFMQRCSPPREGPETGKQNE
jgi:hypothetical protein